MTDTEGGEAAVVETTEKAAPEAAVSSQDTEVNFEAEARKMGWVPEEEFKGEKRPSKFLSAEEYYRRGEEVIPIIRARNKDLEKRLEEQDATIKNMSRMFEKTIERERAKAAQEIAALKTARKEAIKAADAERVDEIDQQIETLQDTTKEEPVSTKGRVPVDGSAEHAALIRDFHKANAWMVEEPDMAEYAEKFSERNAAVNEGISFEDNMAATVAAVRKKFPSYFKDSTTAANGHAAVDGGGSFNNGAVHDETYGLNRIELEQADKLIKAGLYKNRKEWARVYRDQ